MANIITNKNAEKVFKISKYLGINENPDGDTRLQMGEAAHMTNFRITDNYALQKRQGSANVAGLLSAYSISVASTGTTVATDLNTPTTAFVAYPTITVSSGGILTLSGTAVTVNYANLSSYVGYYTTINGQIYQFGTCAYVQPSTGTLVTGGSVSVASSETEYLNTTIPDSVSPDSNLYDSIKVISGTVNTNGGYLKTGQPTSVYKYVSFSGQIYEMTRMVTDVFPSETYNRYHYFGKLISFVGNDTYTWSLKLVTATTVSTDIAVRGLWSGYVNGVECIVSAANGKLWSLTESSGVWTKTEIGTVTTTNGNIHMFGFDKKLYILDGTQYRVWDGTTLSVVEGYRPLVSISNTPTGGGTLLEQVNKLSASRRAWFSPNGTATTFQLPETVLASVDYVKKTSDGSAVTFTANTTTGLVTISPALTAGTNSIEIGWTASASYRSQVVAMKFSETYNGATDTRIFLYGDGSNTAFYSGLDYSGKPTAEHFPDLNVMSVDSANTPITGMIKHYDRLITYKSDGAFITNYGTITLADGTTTSAFYTTPLNREIGNIATGQVKLVKNNPLTLYGHSVYEWQLSSYASKDERNAKTKSDRIAQTLSTLDLTKAICFDDEFHSEYYVVENGTACVYNYKSDVWYVYTNIPATCMITYKQELYYGDTSGYIRHFSRSYMNDCGTAISCYWESGSMDFDADYKLKYSSNLWLGIKPEDYGEIYVTVDTDRQTDYSEKSVTSGFFDWLDLFGYLSFGINTNPQMNKIAIKVKKFVYYKLIFSTVSVDTTATVTSADIKVRYMGNVR